MLSVPLRFTAKEAVPRRGEPVSVGLPCPKGAVKQEHDFVLLERNQARPFHAVKVLDRWPDGSIRWACFEFAADWDGASVESGYSIGFQHGAGSIEPIVPVQYQEATIVELTLPGGEFAFEDWDLVEMPQFRFRCGQLQVECLAKLTTSTSASITLRIVNPSAADHPGGNWDLGNGGSVNIVSFAFRVMMQEEIDNTRISREHNHSFQMVPGTTLQQHGSGGENWQSLNHLDRNRSMPCRQRGYTCSAGDGLRATPIVAINSRQLYFAMTSTRFWELFPQAIHGSPMGLLYSMLPEIEGYDHELQGGESRTYTFTFQWGKETITDEPLVWARSPITATAPPEWYESAEAIPYLTTKANDNNAVYLQLADQAIEGDNTFIHKREVIDEYGWRHFGDIWGDHEAVYYDNPPMISHYNNQYDCVMAFFIQYFRSSDTRWLDQGLECALHTCDIDIYHTTQDKSAYNGGLFWHTYHYAPADTGTHRSYPRSLKNAAHFDDGKSLDTLGKTGQALKKNYAVGGGPSAAHNYNAGLMYAYFLTGDEYYKQSAIGLADFVLNMDDGSKTVFKWLSRADTGLSIQSSAGYLGPGRASANSLHAVLAGFRLTGDRKYMVKATQIVRRVVHPKQNLESLDLLNAELRWFYVMFLQALGHYLDVKIEHDELDDDYCYARLALLHYARDMHDRERPILTEPEKLQYPTETWAAQDMRKVEVFQYAAKHAGGDEKRKFLEKAEWYFRYVETTLNGFATKSLCRPVILMMKYGWTRCWWEQNPNAAAPLPKVMKTADDYGSWIMYVPQKTIAIRRAKRLAVTGAVTGLFLLIALIYWLVR